jgi:phosphohistidine phosphatase SixA
VTVLVVRHAKAGHRESWAGSDFERPVTKRGAEQAEALAVLLPRLPDLDGAPIARILTSPYVRCRQSVEPLAAAIGRPVEDEPALAEGQPMTDVLALWGRPDPEPVVWCTHGDIIEYLLTWLSHRGVVAGELRYAKGSTWVVERGADGDPAAARYVEAP